MNWTKLLNLQENKVSGINQVAAAAQFLVGWEYEVTETLEAQDLEGELSYSYNFLPKNITKRLRKEGTKAKTQFKHPTGRKSTFVKTLTYHGDGKVAQHGGEYDYGNGEKPTVTVKGTKDSPMQASEPETTAEAPKKGKKGKKRGKRGGSKTSDNE